MLNINTTQHNTMCWWCLVPGEIVIVDVRCPGDSVVGEGEVSSVQDPGAGPGH